MNEQDLNIATKQLERLSHADLIRRIVNMEQQISALMAEERPYIFPARKQGTTGFTECTVDGTSLAPMTSGGRSSAATSDPASPVDLGADDFVLLEHAIPGQIKTIRIAGGAIRDLRYNATTHNLQVTYKSVPTEPDWLNRVQFDTCTASSMAGGEAIPLTQTGAYQSSGILDSNKLSAVVAGMSPDSIPISDYNNYEP